MSINDYMFEEEEYYNQKGYKYWFGSYIPLKEYKKYTDSKKKLTIKHVKEKFVYEFIRRILK